MEKIIKKITSKIFLGALDVILSKAKDLLKCTHLDPSFRFTPLRMTNVIFLFLFSLSLISCGAGGTEVGNPVPAPSAAPAGSPSAEDPSAMPAQGVSPPPQETPPVKKIMPHPSQVEPTPQHKNLMLEQREGDEEDQTQEIETNENNSLEE